MTTHTEHKGLKHKMELAVRVLYVFFAAVFGLDGMAQILQTPLVNLIAGAALGIGILNYYIAHTNTKASRDD